MDLSLYPVSFFLSIIALVPCSIYAWMNRRSGWGLPMLMVLGTTAVWYHGDGLYNDYERYRLTMGESALNAAWWQVLLFTVTFAIIVKPIHKAVNRRYLSRGSYLMLFAETNRIKHPTVQRQIDQLAMAMLFAWAILMTIALIRTNYNFSGMFAPYLGERGYPWIRGRMGGGISALLSLAGYLQILMTAGFGVIAALSTNPKTRSVAIAVCCLAFPYYIFDRTRNAMIATMLPGLLAWVFIRIEGGLWKKAAILLVAFMITNVWFMFVVENPIGRGVSVAEALENAQKDESDFDNVVKKESKHEGLSMFSELGYMNDFFDRGTFAPSWGGRYFAEVANIVPRGIWKDKPTIGVDYALARGFGSDVNVVHTGGISASIATGMIGQGVVNFGRLFGPMTAALLMSLWVAILARQDLMGRDPARLLLCVVGLILTFNMGRDITLLVLYPFVFGLILIKVFNYYKKRKKQ
ncbi:hypothetical protein NT6N_26920 [Oceaniferula spumae]|uniref:Oligosaccharide repeat unit polymerase n=1 Tax=Oceaniferula spumae TaxID=2979115 RepID=A0AAT9FP17_9BACT